MKLLQDMKLLEKIKTENHVRSVKCRYKFPFEILQEAKKRQRQRGRLRIRPGPGQQHSDHVKLCSLPNSGRPGDVAGISVGGTRPGSSPLPALKSTRSTPRLTMTDSDDAGGVTAAASLGSTHDARVKTRASVEQTSYAELMDSRDLAKQRLATLQREVCELRNKYNLVKHEIESHVKAKAESEAALHVLEIEVCVLPVSPLHKDPLTVVAG